MLADSINTARALASENDFDGAIQLLLIAQESNKNSPELEKELVTLFQRQIDFLQNGPPIAPQRQRQVAVQQPIVQPLPKQNVARVKPQPRMMPAQAGPGDMQAIPPAAAVHPPVAKPVPNAGAQAKFPPMPLGRPQPKQVLNFAALLAIANQVAPQDPALQALVNQIKQKEAERQPLDPQLQQQLIMNVRNHLQLNMRAVVVPQHAVHDFLAAPLGPQPDPMVQANFVHPPHPIPLGNPVVLNGVAMQLYQPAGAPGNALQVVPPMVPPMAPPAQVKPAALDAHLVPATPQNLATKRVAHQVALSSEQIESAHDGIFQSLKPTGVPANPRIPLPAPVVKKKGPAKNKPPLPPTPGFSVVGETYWRAVIDDLNVKFTTDKNALANEIKETQNMISELTGAPAARQYKRKSVDDQHQATATKKQGMAKDTHAENQDDSE